MSTNKLAHICIIYAIVFAAKRAVAADTAAKLKPAIADYTRARKAFA
jgi:hypothetical protein